MDTKPFHWSQAKNSQLKQQRNISFEEIVLHISTGRVLDIVHHPNSLKYPNQRIFLVLIRDYVWLVPFTETDTEIALKTAIPSRKATREYLARKKDE
jgi:hypothetical protein